MGFELFIDQRHWAPNAGPSNGINDCCILPAALVGSARPLGPIPATDVGYYTGWVHGSLLTVIDMEWPQSAKAQVCEEQAIDLVHQADPSQLVGLFIHDVNTPTLDGFTTATVLPRNADFVGLGLGVQSFDTLETAQARFLADWNATTAARQNQTIYPVMMHQVYPHALPLPLIDLGMAVKLVTWVRDTLAAKAMILFPNNDSWTNFKPFCNAVAGLQT